MAALDGRLRKPPPASRAKPLWAAVGVAAVVTGLAVWWWQDSSVAPGAPLVAQAASAPAARVAAKPPEGASAVALVAASVAVAAAEPAASTVARAVIEEAAPGEPKLASASAPVVAQVAASVAASGASMMPAAAAPAASVVAATPAKVREPKLTENRTPGPRVASTRERGDAGAKTVASKPAATDTASAKADARTPSNVAPAEAAAQGPAAKDADVELLAALMRYSDDVTTPGTGKPKAQSAASRMNELTIADLVKRCKTLGGDEAAQCKKRICSGYWGKADACPAKQAPVASKPKKQPA